jgi:hypothetical protein
MAKKRLTPEELHARLIVTIGVILAIVFAGSVLVFSMRYFLLRNLWRKHLMTPHL